MARARSTTLRAISGIVKARSGSIKFDGEEIANHRRAYHRRRAVWRKSPEGRMVFANLTVMENLRMGAYLRRDKADFAKDLEYIFGIFPRLQGTREARPPARSAAASSRCSPSGAR